MCNFQNTGWFKPFMGDNYVKKLPKLCVAMGPLQKRYPLLNVHVYFAKACRCRVAIPQASKLGKTVASDGTPSKQPLSFRHVPSSDGRTYKYKYIKNIYIYVFIYVCICTGNYILRGRERERTAPQIRMKQFPASFSVHFWHEFVNCWKKVV